MDIFKKFLGLVWIILGLVCAYLCIAIFGLPKIISEKSDDLVFGIIIVFVLTPIIVGGLLIFGYYSLTGEYNNSEQ